MKYFTRTYKQLNRIWTLIFVIWFYAYFSLKDLRDEEEFTNFYGVTYPRIIPYLIGFLSAFVTKVLKEKEYKFSTVSNNNNKINASN